MNVIETNGLSKAFGSKMAVDQFDMHVGQGDIYGFVGRNGAGKSTVMRMLAGLVAPTDGEVREFGMQPREASASRRIGALIESPGLYGSMSATDNLMMKALALGLADPKDKVRDLLDLTGLGSVGSKATKNFSMGMKQRLGLALALLGSPDLLLLDEPLNGLDPEGAREIRRLIMRLNDERGITVVVSSHVLEQLGKMATRYGVIREGRMVREIVRRRGRPGMQRFPAAGGREPDARAGRAAGALRGPALPVHARRRHPRLRRRGRGSGGRGPERAGHRRPRLVRAPARPGGVLR